MTAFHYIEFSGIYPMVRGYQRRIVQTIVTDITCVPLAQGADFARLGGYPFVPMAE